MDTTDTPRTDDHATTDRGREARDADDAPPQGALAWLASCMAREATARDMHNLRRFLVWMLVWFVVAVPDADWFGFVEDQTSWFTVLQAGLVLAALMGVVAGFVRYVRETDELNRTIQLTALSIGFGAGFVAGEIGEAAMNAGLVDSIDNDLPVLAMLVTYAVASAVITRRYA